MWIQHTVSDYLYQIVLVSTVFVLGRYYIGWRRWSNVPPGPQPLPFLGNIGYLRSKDQLQTFRRLRKLFGDVFSLRFGNNLFVIFNGYDTLKEAFIRNGDVFSDRPKTYLMDLMSRGRGISGSSGTTWKETRSFTITALREFGFGKKSMETKLMEEVDAFLAAIHNTNGEPFDIKNTSYTSVSNVICSLIFGHRFDHGDKTFETLLDLLDQNFKLIGHTGILGIVPFLRYLPGDLFGAKRLIKNTVEIKKFFVDQVESHRKIFDETNINDFTDAFLKEQRKHTDETGAIFTDDNLTTLIGNLFSAGTETTATTIRWAVLYLIHYRDIQDRLRQEIDQVIGRSRVPSISDKENMPFFEAFIVEVLRHANIVPLSVAHGSARDTMFRGFFIPGGSILVPNLDSVVNDPKLFQHPDTFCPSRYIGDDGKVTGCDKVTAFSVGRRLCPGEALAKMELFLFLTSLIQNFRLIPDDPKCLPSLQGIMGMTRSPKPFKLRAIKLYT
ncbi:cytochrome P450 2C28-like [Ylistrum balloti]|uniref:cytochrome P450 2C28-like n=1 Tax=Ylistrum balloti TaxID=509963 RepID=UPI0029058F55|nr:cytochrome P450 2C28-like [Ylistrum balloti]